MSKEKTIELYLLKKRVERLIKEFEMNAPSIIIKCELSLIKESCENLDLLTSLVL